MQDSSHRNVLASRLILSIKPSILPLLLAIYPALFHYANNVSIVTLPSLGRTLLLYLTFALLLYFIFFFLTAKQAVRAANVTFIFLIFFNLYGAVYNYLFARDIIRVEHYTLLPLFLFAASYISLLISRMDAARFWKSTFLLISVLVIFNLVRIFPEELEKYRISNNAGPMEVSPASSAVNTDHPDIYFILFDEFAGFDTMRNYWQYEGVDEFAQFLESKGFFVAEASHSSSIDTLQQMAERLNYQEYASGAENRETYYQAITDNRVMSYLTSLGYTTVIFDEKRFGYPAIPKMTADYSFEFDSIDLDGANADLGYLFDEFGILVAENTMLQAFPRFYNKLVDPMFIKHQEMIEFTATNISRLGEIPSPKFVHAHLLLPHYPFLFAEDGTLNDPIYFYNWNYYLGNYIFTMELAKKMVTEILETADPARPPIIILQSDHGARNALVAMRNGVQLENFPEEYKTHVLNALYLPGYDLAQLTQDMKPINTFPIIFNHYFNTEIPLVK